MRIKLANSDAQRPYSPASTSLIAGFSLYIAWSICRINLTLFPTTYQSTYQAIHNCDIIHSALYIIILIGIAIFSSKNKEFKHRTALIIFSTTTMTLGTVLVFYFGWGPGFASLGVTIGVLLTSFEMIFFVCWGEILAQFTVRETCVNVATSFFAAFAICILLFNLNSKLLFITHAALPVASAFFLLSFSTRPLPNFLNPSNVSVTKSHLPYRFFIGFGLLAFLLLLTNDLCEFNTSNTTEINSLISGCLASLAIAIIAILFLQEITNFGAVYRYFAPLLILCLVLLLIAKPGTPPYEIYASAAFWAFFRIITWTMWIYLYKNGNASLITVICGGQIALTLGGIIEKTCKPIIGMMGDPTIPIVAFTIVMTLVLTSVFLNEQYVSQLFKPGSKQVKKAPITDSSDSVDKEIPPYRKTLLDFNLSQREEEIAILVYQGFDNQEIEEKLCIAQSTLKTHLRNIYAKFDVHSRQALVYKIETHEQEKTE